MMTGKEFSAGLRAIADWYDEHPEAPVPYAPRIGVSADDNVETARSIARMLGKADKAFSDSTFSLSRTFGGVILDFVFWRSAVCTKRVVGTKTIPAKPAAPERIEEVVEWDCAPIFEDKTA